MGILGLMKSAAMELGQYDIKVNAVIPGLVNTVTRYEKRLSESIGETGQKVEFQRRNKHGTIGRRQFRCGSVGCSPMIFRPSPSSSRRMPPLS